MNDQFPAITIEGGSVDVNRFIEPGTGTLKFFAFFFAIAGTLFAIIVTYGIFLIILLLYPLFSWYLNRKSLALIHGSGVHVNEEQFPEIYRCLKTFKERLGLTKNIDVYVVESNLVNAFAVRFGKKNVILLTDDLIHSCLASGNPKAISFVIAHELAHISLDHTGLLRAWASRGWAKLRRYDEYSADSVATALVEDRSVAVNGLLIITVGYAMLPYINKAGILKQASEVAQNKYSKKAERHLTHPMPLNRLSRVLQG